MADEINIKSLRIGNIVQTKNGIKKLSYISSSLNSDMVGYYVNNVLMLQNLKDIKPVEINDTYLVALGFIENKDEFIKDIITIRKDKKTKNYNILTKVLDTYLIRTGSVRYVHKLQNILNL